MIINEQMKTKVKGEYDVAVCGGGFAGISAALAAARQGSKAVLFEKQIKGLRFNIIRSFLLSWQKNFFWMKELKYCMEHMLLEQS